MSKKNINDNSVLLNEIAERLWSGHASVMVGAGFSKNATGNTANSKPFLTWSELADIFYYKLHDRSPKDGERYLNPLKLAEEICAAFGRPVLEKLIQSALPDLDYSPSDIYKDLLELPWNDVFTTNYDTLLERTKVTQRYDVVLSKNDLVFSQRPRIIKLHGSFPSQRPFIITEEDYRKYPKDYAPFVNTVQQSLIENTLCLIGFSGDDPNFLSWIGWIRDNLGSTSSPRIFLIGALNLSLSQVKVLEQRNIGIIDLSVFVDEQSDKHKKAMKFFLNFLSEKKVEENRLDWPGKKDKYQSPPTRGVSDAEYISKLKSITDHWSKSREEYPGWVICPHDARKILWMHTSGWTRTHDLKMASPFVVEVKFLRELVWRLEKTLRPIFDDTAAHIEKVISKSNPFSPKLDFKVGGIKELSQIREAWLYLQLSLLRYYREEGKREKWEACFKELKFYVNQMPSILNDNLNYEECLFYLFRQEIGEFKRTLKSWKPDDFSPFNQSKKAGFLAELGELDEAKTLLENALQLVRSQLNLTPITTDYTYLSQESYILQLLKFVNDARSFSGGPEKDDRKYIEEFGFRWTKLKQYKCDPWGELQLFAAKLKGLPKDKNEDEILYGFDIGRRSRTRHIGEDEEALEAFAFLRHMDDIGIPYRIKNMSIGRDAALGAVQRISSHSPSWSLAVVLRVGDKKLVDALFSRNTILQMSYEKVETLIDVLLKLLVDLTNDIERVNKWEDSNIGIHYANIVPEILSRLCTRCSFDKLKEIQKFLFTIYLSPHRSKYSDIDHLAQRLVLSWPPKYLPELANLIFSKIPIEVSDHPHTHIDFPDPIVFLEMREDLGEIQVSLDILNKLLKAFETAEDRVREDIFQRLLILRKYNSFSEQQDKQFAKALWRRVDETGFPFGLWKIFRWYFLELPHPSNIDPQNNLLLYLRGLKFPIIGKSKSIPITGGECRSCSEITNSSGVLERIGWTSEDALLLFQKINHWWLADKHFLEEETAKNFLTDTYKEFRGKFYKASRVIEIAVIPYLSSQVFLNNYSDIMKIIEEMRALKIPVFGMSSALFLKSESFNFSDLFNEFSLEILSEDSFRVEKSISSIITILNSKTKRVSEEEKGRLISLISTVIKWRKVNALYSALAVFKVIVNNYDPIIWDKFVNDVLIGLDFLAEESDTTSGNTNIPLTERLLIRTTSATLAYSIYNNFSIRKIPIPEVIERWKNICHDPKEFAEIRNQWIN